MHSDRKNFWINTIFLLVVIVGFSIYYFVRGDSGAVSFDITEDMFTLRGPESFSVEIALENVSAIEYREDFEPGTCVHGGEVGGRRWGTWANEEFGEYTLNALTKVKAVMIVYEKDGAVSVCNIESAQTTEEFTKAMLQHLRDNGYLQTDG